MEVQAKMNVERTHQLLQAKKISEIVNLEVI